MLVMKYSAKPLVLSIVLLGMDVWFEQSIRLMVWSFHSDACVASANVSGNILLKSWPEV
jgi:hypothetical protein